MPMMTIGHRKLAMHSLSGFDASQIPEAMIGIEANIAMMFRTAVMLLLTPITGTSYHCLCFAIFVFW